MKRRMKQKNKILLLLIISITLLVVSIIAIKNDQKKKAEIASNEANQDVVSYYEDTNIDKLDSLSEKDRIKFYFSQYIDALEDKNYEKAYSFLYNEFKQNYFPTIESYKKYVEKKYPDIIVLNYDNIIAEGYYYIFDVTFDDVMNNTSFNQKFVIREYDFNNVAMSFQAE